MISLILIFIAGICNGICDTLASKPQFDASVFSTFKNQQWWNWSISWTNKHRFAGPTIWNKILDTCFTTFLVFTTDAWHFFKSTFVLLFIISVVLYTPIITTVTFMGVSYLDILALNIVFGLGWQVIQLLIKK